MAAKKSSAKKSAKKSAVKKSVAKKSAKRAPAKKVAKKVAKKAVKKSANKSAARKSASSISIPAVPLSSARGSKVSVVTTPAARPATPAPAKAAPAAKSSNRVLVIVFIGIILLAFIVIGNSKKSSTSTTTTSTPSASASASASMSAASTSSPAASATSAALANHEAPVGIVAHYTASGATIFWSAPTASEGITGYTIEISSNGGAFAAAGKVDGATLQYPVTKSDATGWCSFRVSTLYSDGQVVAGKVFGLPGQYSGS